jgi:hypothetical protein
MIKKTTVKAPAKLLKSKDRNFETKFEDESDSRYFRGNLYGLINRPKYISIKPIRIGTPPAIAAITTTYEVKPIFSQKIAQPPPEKAIIKPTIQISPDRKPLIVILYFS